MTTTTPADLSALQRPVGSRRRMPSEALMAFLDLTGARPSEAQLETFRSYTKMGDPLAEDLVTAMRKLPNGLGRKQFDDALNDGIETVTDPLPELVAFFKEVERVPYWVDFAKIARAQRAVRNTPVRMTFFSTLAITLPASFLNERGGNQLLSRAGGIDSASAGRLIESASWMYSCAQPGGLDRFGDGFKATVRVRLVHAYARLGARAMGGWDDDEWDFPAGQAQTAAGWVPILAGLLSLAMFGAIDIAAQARAVLHMIRYQSHLMGVRPELQMDSLSELARLTYLIMLTDAGTDEHTHHLTHATLDAVPQAYGLPAEGVLAQAIRWAARRFHAEITGFVYGRLRRNFDLPAPSPLLVAVPVIAAYNLVAAAIRRISPAARARFNHRQQQILAQAKARTRSNLSTARKAAAKSEQQELAVQAS